MIILDTHIWIWWVHGDKQLNDAQMDIIKDPTDQIIVATARLYRCPLMTLNDKILKYPYVTTVTS